MIKILGEVMNMITLDICFIKKIYIGNTIVYQQYLSNIKMSILDKYTLGEIDDILL